MLKTVVAGVTVLFVTACPPAHAQTPHPAGPARDTARSIASDSNALTDVRIAIVKAALQLTPEQAKHWPALEDAIRARANARYARIEALEARFHEQRDTDPTELLRQRADTLAKRAAGLKQLADAWQPLYSSLTPDQKQRLQFLGIRVLHVLAERRMQTQDEDEDAGWAWD
jgi:LTXXQ motif family protein